MYTQSVRELNFNSLISVPDSELFNCWLGFLLRNSCLENCGPWLPLTSMS